jgi:hypothetical protein
MVRNHVFGELAVERSARKLRYLDVVLLGLALGSAGTAVRLMAFATLFAFALLAS